MYEFDRTRDVLDLNKLPAFDGKEKAILLIFSVAFVLLVVGVIKFGWYMDEIAALFLGMSFLVAIIARMGFNNYAAISGRGMADVASGSLVIGFARSILVVMNDWLHSILYTVAGLLGSLPALVAAVGMYVFQCLLNFLVPSGSGQASVSIPIMVPLGDGISNIFTPTLPA